MRFLTNPWLWLAASVGIVLVGGAIVFRETRATQRVQDAQRLFEEGKYAEAIVQLDAVPQAKMTPELLTLRGRAHGRSGRPDAAWADAAQALQLSPRFADAYVVQGVAALDKNRLDQSLQLFTKAIELDPKLMRAYFNRGIVYLKLNRLPETIADYSKVLELDPKDVGARIQRAIAELDSGKPQEALKDLNEAIRLNENAAFAYLVRSAVQFDLGEHALAEDDLTTAKFLKVDLSWRELPFSPRGSGEERIAPGPGGPTERTVDIAVPPWPKPNVSTLIEHTNEVKDVAYSPNARWLATASYDSKVLLYDAQTLAKQSTLADLALPLRFVAFSPDSAVLAAGYAGNNLEQLDRVLSQGPNDTAIALWDAAQGKHLRTLPGRYQWVSAMEFSASGKSIYAAYWRRLPDRGRFGDLSVWDVDSGAERQRLTLNQGGVDALAVSSDERWLVTGTSAPKSDSGETRSATIEVWDLSTGRSIKQLTHPWARIASLAIDGHDGSLLASGGGLQRWRTADWTSLLERRQPGDHLQAMAVSPDGRTLAVIDVYRGVCLLDADTGVFLESLKSNKTAMAQAWSADGQRLAIAMKQGEAEIHDVALPARKRALAGPASYRYAGLINAIAWRPGRRQAAIAGTGKTIALVDFDEQGKITGEKALVGHKAEVQALVFSADGEQLYSAGGGQWDPRLPGEILAWDLASLGVRRSFTGFTKGVSSLSLDPSGKRLAAAHHDQPWAVRLWDVESGLAVATLHCGHAPQQVAFAPDGTLAALALREARLWSQASLAGDLGQEPKSDRVFKVELFGLGDSLAWSGSNELALGNAFGGTLLLEPRTDRALSRWQGSQVQLAASGQGFTAGAPVLGEYAMAWDREGRPLAALIDNKLATITNLALSNEWGWLAAGRRDGSISIWDVSHVR